MSLNLCMTVIRVAIPMLSLSAEVIPSPYDHTDLVSVLVV